MRVVVKGVLAILWEREKPLHFQKGKYRMARVWLRFLITKRYRAEGDEKARAGADKEREIILAKAYKKSQTLIGDGDAQATIIYAKAFGQDPEFYAFLRRLEAYEKIFAGETTLVLSPESVLLRYLENPRLR